MPGWVGDIWRIIVVPDSQTAILNDPTIFDAQTQWIADNAVSLDIKLVLHLGDIVQDGGVAAQWQDASDAWDVVDTAEVPYLMACGNHDYDDEAANPDRGAVNYNADFGTGRYTAHGWWSGGFKDVGHAENAYLLFAAGGRSYIAINMECFPTNATRTWADGLLTTYAARDAIVVTHNYMYPDDTRQQDPGDDYGPDDYAIGGNDGEDIWQGLIKNHDNIILVYSGHQLQLGAARRIDYSDGGQAVHQHLANYQDGVTGLNRDGQQRTLTVVPANAMIVVETYSPELAVYRMENGHRFVMDYA